MGATWVYEIGSNHCGDIRAMQETFDFLYRNRSVYHEIVLKVQLFPNREPFVGSGNYHVDRQFFRDIVAEAKAFRVPVTASVFDHDCLEILLTEHPSCPFIKIAYSQKNNHDLVRNAAESKITIVSCDHLSKPGVYKHCNIKHIYCIAMYPVPFALNLNKFLFTQFEGFSDHTLGTSEAYKAYENGAKIIEKHVLPANHEKFSIDCPDATFSITAQDFMRVIYKCKE